MNKVREHLAVHNPDALFYGERYDAALVGVTEGFRGNPETAPVAVYDHEILIDLLAAEFASQQVEIYSGEIPEDVEEPRVEAIEWIGHNMAGAYHGSNAPIIAWFPESDRLESRRGVANRGILANWSEQDE